MSMFRDNTNNAGGTAQPAGSGDAALAAMAGLQSRRWVPTQPIVLVLIALVSGGMLYAMRNIGTKSAIAVGEGKKFEFDAQEDRRAQEAYERVIAELSSVNNPLDIALVDFGRSPFVLASQMEQIVESSGPVLPSSLGPSKEELAAQRAAQRRAMVANEAAKLRVQSVMGGRRPIARINDETVQVGDRIGEVFLIVAIDGRSVTIEGEGQRFVLTMEDPMETRTGGKGGRKN